LAAVVKSKITCVNLARLIIPHPGAFVNTIIMVLTLDSVQGIIYFLEWGNQIVDQGKKFRLDFTIRFQYNIFIQ